MHKYTWWEQNQDFEGHELVVVHAGGLDHAHEIVELRDQIVQI